MPQKTDPRRDRPTAGQSGSTSAAFAFATEPPQQGQPTLPTNGATVSAGSNVASTVPQLSNQSFTTGKPTSHEDAEGAPTTAGAVADEIDQLENEVVHFMTLSMEEKEKSEVLSGRLASVTQEKEDLKRQVDELDQELSQIGWPGQDDGASATEAGDTISRVNAKITKLRTKAQELESNFNNLAAVDDQHTRRIAELDEQLRTTREQLAQKTQEEERLRKELEQATAAVGSEKNTNEKLLNDVKTLELKCNGLGASNTWNSKKLAEAEQTTGTLIALVKQKDTQLEKVQKDGTTQAETMRQELDRRQKEIESLRATQKDLEARCEQSESALRERPRVKRIKQPEPTLGEQSGAKHIPKAGEAVEATRTRRLEKDAIIKHLTEQLQRNQKRRVRAVAIGIDLSGSAAGSLTEGIKRLYAHLLSGLQRSPCQTYVMTVVHGPGDTASVKSNFGDTWAAHGKVLEGQKADGMEQHVECLRKIKEVAVSTGLVLDLQVVLLGDSNTNQASHVGAQEVCTDFASSNPTVHIHSVAVKTGSAEETEKYWNNLEAWHPWNYASATGGNMVVWWQNSPLPDLGNLVY